MKRSLTIMAIAALALAACGGETASTTPTAETSGGTEAAGDANHGEEVFTGTCSSCHGPDAMGLEGLGRQLVGNTFVAERSDADMLDFIQTGRPASDPANEVGVDMPPRGGNPSLSDEDLLDVIAYLRTLE